VTAVDTEAQGHATAICRDAAAEGYDVVCAFGGDGTVNEAANGLAGTSTPLAVLPGGSQTFSAAASAFPATSSTPPSTSCASPTRCRCERST
jgi:diacylglycerol kinase family enzyme